MQKIIYHKNSPLYGWTLIVKFPSKDPYKKFLVETYAQELKDKYHMKYQISDNNANFYCGIHCDIKTIADTINKDLGYMLETPGWISGMGLTRLNDKVVGYFTHFPETVQKRKRNVVNVKAKRKVKK